MTEKHANTLSKSSKGVCWIPNKLVMTDELPGIFGYPSGGFYQNLNGLEMFWYPLPCQWGPLPR